MFPRSQRLQQRQVFDPLYRRGRTARGAMLTVRCITFELAGLKPPTLHPAGDTEVPSRIVAIVSKKVSRKAVDRNRIKRRVRHQLIEFSGSLAANHCIAVSANRPRGRNVGQTMRPLLLTCPTRDIHRELRHLLEQVQLLNDCSEI